MSQANNIDLIINADDYGYFPCVSQGIIEAAQSGSLTATGILANSADLNTQFNALRCVENIDLGVHLNLTLGKPLTKQMTDQLSASAGQFPSAYVISGLLLSRKLRLETVKREWSAQIEACQSQALVFLNSHEHIHMFPPLFPLTLELARLHNIKHVRLTQADWLKPFTPASLLRNTLMQGMCTLNQFRLKNPPPIFLGLSCSGKLTYEYLAHRLSTLKPGQRYELMCHPGHFDVTQITDPKLLCYHDWTAELALLQSPKVHDLYQQYHIRLIRY